MTITHCPHCQHPLHEERVGVILPAIKVRIFDAIASAGPDGIDSRAVLAAAYRDDEQPKHVGTVRTHIAQINRLLMKSRMQIECIDRRRWRLVKRVRKRPRLSVPTTSIAVE
jgi:hypothetical protein